MPSPILEQVNVRPEFFIGRGLKKHQRTNILLPNGDAASPQGELPRVEVLAVGAKGIECGVSVGDIAVVYPDGTHALSCIKSHRGWEDLIICDLGLVAYTYPGPAAQSEWLPAVRGQALAKVGPGQSDAVLNEPVTTPEAFEVQP